MPHHTTRTMHFYTTKINGSLLAVHRLEAVDDEVCGVQETLDTVGQAPLLLAGQCVAGGPCCPKGINAPAHTHIHTHTFSEFSQCLCQRIATEEAR